MGPPKGPRTLLLAALFISVAVWVFVATPRQENESAVQHPAERTGQVEQPRQQNKRRQLKWNYPNASLDDPGQREALLALYNATNGVAWKVPSLAFAGTVPWGTEGSSYCRWFGVTCCASSPLSLVDCTGLHSVVILSLDGFGLAGSLPEALSDLAELTILGLANNPQLVGGLPESLASLQQLLWLSVEDTGLVACTEAGSGSGGGGSGGLLPVPVTGPCSLPPCLQYTDKLYSPYATNDYVCPATILTSFLNYTSTLPPDLWDLVTSPFPPPPTPGAVVSSGNFTRFFNCSCRDGSETLEVQDAAGSGGSGAVSVQCVSPGSGGRDSGRLGLIVGIVVVAVVPWLLVAAAVYICVVHKATLNRLVRRKEAEMARKRSKVPGTPGVALQNGRGVLSLSDVMVTWVVTDVAASTQLWEWKPDVMDRAIDLHNAALRSLMDEFGGHEIRNEGDSFTLSFHDAVDAVNFCLKAQEKLMTVDWPKELAEHPRTNVVSVGDVTSNPDAVGKGPPLIAGLRVRMGINTGVPDDIFLHDLTDHVDYRGLEYDLAGEICDLAEGGQVLMGPRTLQRWNKVNYAALIDPLTADLLREQQGGSFLQVNSQPPALLHGPSGRRGSLTGFGAAMGGGGINLARESQQLGLYGSSYGLAGGTAGPAVTGLGLTANATMRRNSDSQQPHSGAGPTFVRGSEGEDGVEDEVTSTPPTTLLANTALMRSLRVHRSSSPSRILRSTPTGRTGTHSSDGTVAPGSSKTAGLGSPLAPGARSKLGSPRAVHGGGGLYSETGISGGGSTSQQHRARAATVTATTATPPGGNRPEEGEAGKPATRPVRRVNSTEGLLRLHALRAGELAAAAAAAAAAASAAATGGSTRTSQGGRGHGLEVSDDDRGSPHNLPQVGLRLSNARASAGSNCDGGIGGPGQGRRRGDDGDFPGTSGASGPLSIAPALQRWLSHGWRGAPVPALPRAHTANSGSLAGAAAAALAAAGQSAGGGGAASLGGAAVHLGPRSSNGGVSVGGKLLWLRLHGGATARGLAAMVRRGVTTRTSGRRAGLAMAGISNFGNAEGPASMPVVPLDDELNPAVGSGTSGRGLNRISSLPANAISGGMASGVSRLAVLQRRGAIMAGGANSEGVSREGSLRHQNPLYLRNHSREGSRDERGDTSPGNVTPARADSAGQPHLPQQSGPGVGMGTANTLEIEGAGNSAGGTLRHPAAPGGGRGSGTALLPSSPVLGPGGYMGTGDGLRPGRRNLTGMPGPPRMSLASETGLHPLLLNPMQPGGLAAMPMHPLLGRMTGLRPSRPSGLMPLAPSPLGLVAGTSMELAPGPPSGVLQEQLVQGADSITSAGANITRGLTAMSAHRQLNEQARGSGDGGGPGGVFGAPPRGDSGSLVKAPSIGHQGPGPHAQLSYQQNMTQGGYFLSDLMDADAGASAMAALPGAGGAQAPLVVRLLARLHSLWCELAGAFRSVLRRCLRCVRLLTSSDDDPADVDVWEHADSAVLQRGPGAHKTATVGSKPQETKGVLVDMGYYNFMSVDYNGQMPVGHYVHLMQIVPSSVAPRVLLFPWPLSLPTGWEKISPGFFDAPGSTRLLFPAMRELMAGDMQAMRPVVTVAFSSIEGVKELSAVSVEAARDVLQLHNAAVRETLSTCSGYECKEFNGSFMTTFAAPTSAVEWALTLQLALVAMPWPDELLACEHAAVVLHPETDQVLFRGLRCRVGIYAGPIDRVTPHPKTGRADYFGQPVNRAARLMTAAQGGQVVLDQSLLDEVLDEWKRRQEIRRLATIPSLDEELPAEECSLVAPSEMRTARSFVSAKSTNRLLKQHSAAAIAAGSLSAAASSTPSITNLPDLPMQPHNTRSDGTQGPSLPASVSAAAGGMIAATSGSTTGPPLGIDGMPASPFGSPGGSMLSKMLSNNAVRDYATDGSVSPRGSANPALSPCGTSTNTTACGGGPGAGAVASGGTGPGVGVSVAAIHPAMSQLSNSNTASLARSLERLLSDQRSVQRSARSEPRIPRISRFGLGGITAALRGGGRAAAAAATASCGSPRSGAAGASSAIGSTLIPLPPLPSTPPHSSSIATISTSAAPWLPDAPAASPAPTPGRSVSFLNRSLGGGRATGSTSLGITRSPASSSLANGLAIGGSSGGVVQGAPGPQGGPWLNHALILRTSPSTSLHDSHAGGASVGGADPSAPTAGMAAAAPATTPSGPGMSGISLAAGLELQPAQWDPNSRGAVSTRARRRRRASIGAIVENLLVSSRKASSHASAMASVGGATQGASQAGTMRSYSQHHHNHHHHNHHHHNHHHHNHHHHNHHHASRGSGTGQSGYGTPVRSPPSRVSPAALAARARLVPGSPGSPASIIGGGVGGGMVPPGGPSPFGAAVGLQVELPDSPSTSTALASPHSPGSSKALLVRRMASSPLGWAAFGFAAPLGMDMPAGSSGPLPPVETGSHPLRQSVGGGSMSSGSHQRLHGAITGAASGPGLGSSSRPSWGAMQLAQQIQGGRSQGYQAQHYRYHSFQHRNAQGADQRSVRQTLPNSHNQTAFGAAHLQRTSAQMCPTSTESPEMRAMRGPSPLRQGSDGPRNMRAQSGGDPQPGGAAVAQSGLPGGGSLDRALSAAVAAETVQSVGLQRGGSGHSSGSGGGGGGRGHYGKGAMVLGSRAAAAVLSSVAEGQTPSSASTLGVDSNTRRYLLATAPPHACDFDSPSPMAVATRPGGSDWPPEGDQDQADAAASGCASNDASLLSPLRATADSTDSVGGVGVFCASQAEDAERLLARQPADFGQAAPITRAGGSGDGGSCVGREVGPEPAPPGLSVPLIACRGSVAGAPATSTTANAVAPLSPELLDTPPEDEEAEPGTADGLKGRLPRADIRERILGHSEGTPTGGSGGVASFVDKDSYMGSAGPRDLDSMDRPSASSVTSAATSPEPGFARGAVRALAARGKRTLLADAMPPGMALVSGSLRTSQRTSQRTSLPSDLSSPASIRLAEGSMPRLPPSERSSPPPATHPTSQSASTASSTLTRRVFEGTISAAASGYLHESDLMPSFAANLITRPSVGDRPSNASAAGVGGTGGAGASSSSMRSEADLTAAAAAVMAAAAGGFRAAGPAPMLSRGFAVLHGNPAYGIRRSVAGEDPIEEEGPAIESMDLIATNANSSRGTVAMAAAAAPSPMFALRQPRLSAPHSQAQQQSSSQHGSQQQQQQQQQLFNTPQLRASSEQQYSQPGGMYSRRTDSPTGLSADPHASLLLGLPPMVGAMGLLPATGRRQGDGTRRSSAGPSNGPDHAGNGNGPSSLPPGHQQQHAQPQPAQQPQQPPLVPSGAPPAVSELMRGGPAGRRRCSRNSSIGTTYSSAPINADSPTVSDVYGYGRSGTNDEGLLLAAANSGGGVLGTGINGAGTGAAGAGNTMARQGTHSSKNTSGSLYGITTQPTALTSFDATTLAALTGGASVSGAGPSTSGGTQSLAGLDGAITLSSLPTAGLVGTAIARTSGAGPRYVGPTSPGHHPALFPGSAAGRRRASSGAVGVSLRAAAEVAINQLHQSAIAAAAAAAAAAQQQHPATPMRALRKSLSSRGRRHHAGSAGGDARHVSSPNAVADGLAQALAATVASAGGAATRASRTSAARLLRVGAASEVSPGGANPGHILSPAVEQLAAFVSPIGGLDLRAPPSVERSGGGRNAGAGSSVPRLPGSEGGGMGLGAVMGARRSAPGHAFLPVMAYAFGSGAGVPQHLPLPESLRTPTRSSATSVVMGQGATAAGGGGGSSSGGVGVSAGALAGPAGAQLPASLATAPYGATPSVAGTVLDSSSSTGMILGALRRSSAGSHAYPQPSGSPSHASPPTYALQQLHQHQQQQQHLHTYQSASSAVYTRHGAASETLLQPSSQPATAPPGLHRSHRPSYSVVAVGNTAPNTPLTGSTSVSTNSNVMRVGMNRSSTPQVPGSAGAGGAVGAGTGIGTAVGVDLPQLVLPLTGAASAGAGGNSGGAGAATPMAGAGGGGGSMPNNVATLHMARLRASNQSLPEDLLASTPLSAGASRELSRPSELVVTVGGGGGGGGPPTVRGSRWRSPRGPGAASGGEDGGGGGAGAAMGSAGGPGGGGLSGSPERGAAAAGAAGGQEGAGAAGGAGGSKEKEKENRPAVMAECYKITQQPAGGMGGGGNEVAQSITMIKYTNLKQELERAEGEGDDVPVPTNMLLVPTVAVEVAIWSLGAFRLKGVTEPIKIVQVLPVELAGRLAFLNKAGLNRGKARCIERRAQCLDVITLQLPDVSRLSCVSMAAGASPGGSLDGAGVPGGAGHDGLGAMQSGELNPLGGGADGGWAGPHDAPGDIGGGGGYVHRVMGMPIVLGQVTSPSEAAARWGALRSTPLREIESSEAGLPPISEVVTPVSSPILRAARDGQAHSHSHVVGSTSTPASGSPPVPQPGGDIVLPRRRSILTPPNLTMPDEPLSPGDDASSGAPPSLAMPQAGAVVVTPQPLRRPKAAPSVLASDEIQDGSVGDGSARPQWTGSVDTAGLDPPRPVYLSRRPPPLLGRRGASSCGAPPSGYQPGLGAARAVHHRSSADQVGGLPTMAVAAGSAADAFGMPRRLSSAAGGGGGGDSASASSAQPSTGLLPMSLSYMAPRQRDTHSSYAAMVAAGMDVRSPGGSPVNTPFPQSALGLSFAAVHPGGGYLPSLDEAGVADKDYGGTAAAAAASNARSPGGAAAALASTGSMPLLQDRGSNSTTQTPHSALVIDRSSSGFNHALSSSHTPVPAYTDRSSYGSSMVPPHFTATDRTSSGLDWPSSGHRTPSPLARGAGLGLGAGAGAAGLDQGVRSHASPVSLASTGVGNSVAGSGAVAGAGAGGPHGHLPERPSPTGFGTWDSSAVGSTQSQSGLSVATNHGTARPPGSMRSPSGAPVLPHQQQRQQLSSLGSADARLLAALAGSPTLAAGVSASHLPANPSRLSGSRAFTATVPGTDAAEIGVWVAREPSLWDPQVHGGQTGSSGESVPGHENTPYEAEREYSRGLADGYGRETDGVGEEADAAAGAGHGKPAPSALMPQPQRQSPPPSAHRPSRPALLQMVQQRMLAGHPGARSPAGSGHRSVQDAQAYPPDQDRDSTPLAPVPAPAASAALGIAIPKTAAAAASSATAAMATSAIDPSASAADAPSSGPTGSMSVSPDSTIGGAAGSHLPSLRNMAVTPGQGYGYSYTSSGGGAGPSGSASGGAGAGGTGMDSVHTFDLTVSIRSSMGGSTAGGRVSNAGLAAVDSLRTFGLSQLPMSAGTAEPVSASELLRPFADGHSGGAAGSGEDAAAGRSGSGSRLGSGVLGSAGRFSREGAPGDGGASGSGSGSASANGVAAGSDPQHLQREGSRFRVESGRNDSAT